MQSRLIGIRKYHKDTQQQIADILGISRELYSKKENGHTEFTCNEMFLLAKRYNVSIESLFLPINFT